MNLRQEVENPMVLDNHWNDHEKNWGTHWQNKKAPFGKRKLAEKNI